MSATNPELDPQEVATAATVSVARVAALVERVSDPTAPVPGLGDWTVHDLVAHLSIGPSYYLGGADGTTRFAADGTEMPTINAANIAAVGEQPLAELRATMVAGYDRLSDTLRRQGHGGPRCAAHGGAAYTLVEATALLLGELAVHGFDLARALDAPWEIPSRDVELLLWGAAPILPAWVNPATAAGHTADYELRVRGQGRHRWRFDAGALVIEPEGSWRPDVVISGAPASLLLVFYGRLGQLGPMLRGQLVAWGRRPWLALTLSRRLLPA